jgi:WD40 repeat protein
MKFIIKLMVFTLALSACGPVTPITVETTAAATPDEYQDFAYDIVWSQDDSMVALTTQTGLYVYDVKTYKELFSFNQNGSTAVFGKDYLAFINWQGLFVYDLDGFKLLWSEESKTGRMFQNLAISPDDKILVAGEQDRMRVWSLPDGKVLSTITDDDQVFWQEVVFKEDSKLIVISDNYLGHVQEWDTEGGKRVRQFGFGKSVANVRLSNDGTLALVDYGTPGFQLWDTRTGKISQNYGDIISATGWQRLSGDNHYAVVWGYGLDGINSGMSVWDLDVHLQVREFKTPFVNGDGWRCGALNSDGSVLAASDNQGYIYFYDVEAGEKLGEFFLPYQFSFQ